MEFLTILGTITSGALDQIQARLGIIQLESTPHIAGLGELVGSSKAMREVYSQIESAAANGATVLIEGESGTGKELVARAIHQMSSRAKAPFVPVDCGAIPETLIESELFGSRKGSFTGATQDRQGLFESANHGTLFLDEIGNTSRALQAKLLRVIQEREVRRIGDARGRSIDVRLIVASNLNLDALVKEGRFRHDLLYRLKVLHVVIPPLRDRRDDIPQLAHFFLKRLNTVHKEQKRFSEEAISRLKAHPFPGNVRELQNVVERSFFLSKGKSIEPSLQEARASTSSSDDIQAVFKDLTEGRKDFWTNIRDPYKRRDISREKVIALMDLGLRSTRGSYKMLASLIHVDKGYRKLMDFLRRNDCLLDFRPYRKGPGNPPLSQSQS
jgi:DNA-binding NtrC family response regulator